MRFVRMAGQFNTIVDIGDPMPTFENLPATDGSTVSSSAIEEDVVVLVSLANHCPWVQGMDRDLVALVDQLEGHERARRSVRGESSRGRPPAGDEGAREAKAGYNFTYVYDESQALGRALGATRTPEYFVFDKNRKLVYMGAHPQLARTHDERRTEARERRADAVLRERRGGRDVEGRRGVRRPKRARRVARSNTRRDANALRDAAFCVAAASPSCACERRSSLTPIDFAAWTERLDELPFADRRRRHVGHMVLHVPHPFPEDGGNGASVRAARGSCSCRCVSTIAKMRSRWQQPSVSREAERRPSITT